MSFFQPTSRPSTAIFLLGVLILATVSTIAVSQTPPSPENAVRPAWSHPSETSPAAGFVPNVGSAGDMIGFSHSDDSGTQTITLVDTSKSWMAVYHIDRSGTIRLVSSRPIDADFSLQHNVTAPLPDEIRQMGER